MPVLRDIAIVCSINNKSEIKHTGKEFIKYGEPTECALKVAAEKIGQYDPELPSNTDY